MDTKIIEDLLVNVGQQVVDQNKSNKTVAKVLSILPFALPIAKLVTASTSTKLDDKLIDIVERLGHNEWSLTPSTNKFTQDAIKMEITAEMLREDLLKRVKNNEVIKFADRELKTREDVLLIPRRLLKSTAEMANSVNKDQ